MIACTMSTRLAVVLLVFVGLALQRSTAFAHCDAMDGPVVQAARAALDENDVALVLRWVPGDEELAVRTAFAQTMAVRALGSDAPFTEPAKAPRLKGSSEGWEVSTASPTHASTGPSL